jgi:hypothetical protein
VLSASDFAGEGAFFAELGLSVADGANASFDHAASYAQAKDLVLGIVSAVERVTVPIFDLPSRGSAPAARKRSRGSCRAPWRQVEA